MDFLNDRLVTYMPFVQRCREDFRELGLWWSRVALTGKINSQGIAGNLLESMEATKQRFEALQDELVSNLVREKQGELHLELHSRARMILDLLIRNLYERTADVGFLAMDQAIRTFMLQRGAADEGLAQALHERLQAYVSKYTVYDDLLLITPAGEVVLQLQPEHPVQRSTDPLLKAVLDQPDGWQEVFRASDLQPNKHQAHLFASAIRQDDSPDAPILGVLCLSFDFSSEIETLFRQFAMPGQLLALIDISGRVLASSDSSRLPTGSLLDVVAQPQLYLVQHAGQQYLSCTVKTTGYQGYRGLPWLTHIMLPLQFAFADGDHPESLAPVVAEVASSSPDGALNLIRRQAVRITEDLSLAVLNGQILAARCRAVEFVPVLNEIRGIGLQTQEVFQRSILTLQQTIAQGQRSEACFRAYTALDIMDRNLYERANDVRWWALTQDFRELLAVGCIDGEDAARLTSILVRLNQLYSVYASLLLFDGKGVLRAVSTPAHAAHLGSGVPQPFMAAMQLPHSQAYAVTDFEPSPFYDNRPTYTYLGAVLAPEGREKVGGLALVFDSEPQFLQMLTDVLPRNAEGEILAGCWAAFTTLEGQVIACTDQTNYPPGSHLPPQASLQGIEQQPLAISLQSHGRQYVVGYARSRGYREYKTSDGYSNDLLAQVYIAV